MWSVQAGHESWEEWDGAASCRSGTTGVDERVERGEDSADLRTLLLIERRRPWLIVE